MKPKLSLLLLAASLASAPGQGTFYYEAHLEGNAGSPADATFSLTANVFSYDFQVAYGLGEGQIRSPWPDTNAPVVFNLNFPRCVPPLQPVEPGYCRFSGSRTISNQEALDLQAGRWYAYVLAGGSPFFLQGQIVPIPEPRGPELFCLAASLCWLYRRSNF